MENFQTFVVKELEYLEDLIASKDATRWDKTTETDAKERMERITKLLLGFERRVADGNSGAYSEAFIGDISRARVRLEDLKQKMASSRAASEEGSSSGGREKDDVATKLKKTMEKIKEREEAQERELKERHRQQVDAERAIREELARKEEAARRERELATRAKDSRLAWGTVIHVVGREDLATKERLAGKHAVLIDFFAPWCGPCRAIAPFLEQLAARYSDVLVLSVDTEDPANKPWFPSMGVRAFPTFELKIEGRRLAQVVGADPRALEAAVAKAALEAEEIITREALSASSYSSASLSPTSAISITGAGTQALTLTLRSATASMPDCTVHVPIANATLGELYARSESATGVRPLRLIFNGTILPREPNATALASLRITNRCVIQFLPGQPPSSSSSSSPTRASKPTVAVAPPAAHKDPAFRARLAPTSVSAFAHALMRDEDHMKAARAVIMDDPALSLDFEALKTNPGNLATRVKALEGGEPLSDAPQVGEELKRRVRDVVRG